MNRFAPCLLMLGAIHATGLVHAQSVGTDRSGLPEGAAAPGGPTFDGSMPVEANGADRYRETVREVELLDQHERPFSLGRLAGQTILLHFVFTDCRSICPLQAKTVERIRHSVKTSPLRARISFVSITVSPEIDTPEKMLAFSSGIVEETDTDELSDWYFVTGETDSVIALGTTLGVVDGTAGDGVPTHGTTLFLLDSEGRLRQRYRGSPADAERISKEIRLLASLGPR